MDFPAPGRPDQGDPPPGHEVKINIPNGRGVLPRIGDTAAPDRGRHRPLRRRKRAIRAADGIGRMVAVTVSARHDGTALQVTGSIPVALAAWHIKGPADFGFLGSMAGHGVAEFLLTLRPP